MVFLIITIQFNCEQNIENGFKSEIKINAKEAEGIGSVTLSIYESSEKLVVLTSYKRYKSIEAIVIDG